ncbi:hypothetical protein H2198_008636 [Neophaeococcomyces mojaviensis]|uniref:Uncharacterized protein n=1 Tax=Neophaeococcomyces mojaviensis TaxID=3383035 RepID=A0ACC2ZWP4_9EURO|nr:hypothetical protein H2198_008636 [Knufia sp. JES_112]
MSEPQRNSSTEKGDMDDRNAAYNLPQPLADFTQTSAFLHPRNPNSLSPQKYMLYRNLLSLHDRLGRIEDAVVEILAATSKSRTNHNQSSQSSGAQPADQVVPKKASGAKIPAVTKSAATNLMKEPSVHVLLSIFKKFVESGKGSARSTRRGDDKARANDIIFFDKYLCGSNGNADDYLSRCRVLDYAAKEELYLQLSRNYKGSPSNNNQSLTGKYSLVKEEKYSDLDVEFSSESESSQSVASYKRPIRTKGLSEQLPSSDLGLDNEDLIGLPAEQYVPRPSKRRSRAETQLGPKPEVRSSERGRIKKPTFEPLLTPRSNIASASSSRDEPIEIASSDDRSIVSIKTGPLSRPAAVPLALINGNSRKRQKESLASSKRVKLED